MSPTPRIRREHMLGRHGSGIHTSVACQKAAYMLSHGETVDAEARYLQSVYIIAHKQHLYP